MKKLHATISPITDALARYMWLVGVAVVAILLTIRNSGLFPSVFSDEWTYNRMARLAPLSTAEVPNYLYFLFYRVTNFAHDSFYQANQILNTAFFVTSGVFLYAISRKIAPPTIASLITIVSLLIPANIYTAWFMPEAMYMFMFWFSVWALLQLDARSSITKFSYSGAVLGFASLVKPHALFLAPAVIVYFIWLILPLRGKEALSAFRKGCCYIAAALVIKMLVGIAIAGAPGATLFGATYGTIVRQTAAGSLDFGHVLHALWFVATGHIAALLVLFGTPIVIISISMRKCLVGSREDITNRLVVFTLACLGVLVATTIVFTVSAHLSMGGSQTLCRLHMRYYGFATPLLYLCSVAIGLKNIAYRRSVLATVLILGVTVWIGFKASGVLNGYSAFLVDSPELFAAIHSNVARYITIVMSAAALVATGISFKWGALCYTLLTVPVINLTAFLVITHHVKRDMSAPDVYFAAGEFARQMLNADEKDQLLVVGDSHAGLTKALFAINNALTQMQVVENRELMHTSSVQDDVNTILTIGNDGLQGDYLKVRQHAHFDLYTLKASGWLRFQRSHGARGFPSFIDSVNGLSFAEDWGTWSDGALVTINFTTRLPSSLQVRLSAFAHKAIAGRLVTIEYGSASKTAIFQETLTTQSVVLNSENPAQAINIRMPVDVLKDNDGHLLRNLGLGFVEIQIEATELASPDK